MSAQTVSRATEAAREAARERSGQFGAQAHSDPGVVDPTASAASEDFIARNASRLDGLRDQERAARVVESLNDAHNNGDGAWEGVISKMRLDDAATEKFGGWGGDAFVTEDQELFVNDGYPDGWSYAGPYGAPTRGVGTTGEVYFMLNGRLHNVDGPAVIHLDGTLEYWVNGRPSPAPVEAPVRGAGYLPDDLTPPF